MRTVGCNFKNVIAILASFLEAFSRSLIKRDRQTYNPSLLLVFHARAYYSLNKSLVTSCIVHFYFFPQENTKILPVYISCHSIKTPSDHGTKYTYMHFEEQLQMDKEHLFPCPPQCVSTPVCYFSLIYREWAC